MLWSRLQLVNRMISYYETRTDKISHFKGQVLNTINGNSIKFKESGVWSNFNNEYHANNTLIWRKKDNSISVSRLRKYQINPEPLVTLIPAHDTSTYINQSIYHCGSDTYELKVRLTDSYIVNCWTIIGPNKNHVLTTYYLE